MVPLTSMAACGWMPSPGVATTSTRGSDNGREGAWEAVNETAIATASGTERRMFTASRRRVPHLESWSHQHTPADEKRDRAECPDRKRYFERQSGRALPEQPARDSRGDDDQGADGVVHTDRSRPLMVPRQVDNQRFARGLADFFQPAEAEGADERGEAGCETHGQREHRKEYECERDEGTASRPVRNA